MLTQLDQQILGEMAWRGPSPREIFQARRDAELTQAGLAAQEAAQFSKSDAEKLDKYEAHIDVRQATRKDLLPLEVEGMLNRSYEDYMASGAADITWVRSY